MGKAVQSSRKVVAKVVSPQSVATPNACRLHVFMTYQAFPTEQLDRACKAHMTGAAPTCEEALADNVSPNLRRLLTGGVLFVRVLSASDLDFSKKHKVLGGIGRKIKVKVRYGGQLKSTVALTGRHHTYAFDGELEFVVDGDQVAASEVIEVEVWDVHWRNALLGVGVIPFADVKKESTGLSVSLQLEGAKKGQVDLRCEWLGMMTGALEKAA